MAAKPEQIGFHVTRQRPSPARRRDAKRAAVRARRRAERRDAENTPTKTVYRGWVI